LNGRPLSIYNFESKNLKNKEWNRKLFQSLVTDILVAMSIGLPTLPGSVENTVSADINDSLCIYVKHHPNGPCRFRLFYSSIPKGVNLTEFKSNIPTKEDLQSNVLLIVYEIFLYNNPMEFIDLHISEPTLELIDEILNRNNLLEELSSTAFKCILGI
jgi:hypothetical protein